MQQIGRGDVRMQREADAAQAEPGNLLDHHRAIEEIGAHAAIRFRDVRTQQTRLPGLVPQGAIHMPILLPLRVERYGVLLEEFLHTATEELMVSTEQGSWNHCYHLIAMHWVPRL